VSAGPESEARIEHHDGRIGSCDPLVMWADPQTLAETQRVEVLQPFTLPHAVGDRLHLDQRGINPELGGERPCQCRRGGWRNRCMRKQTLDPCGGPERRFPGGWLEQRVVTRIDQGDRDCAAVESGIFRGLRIEGCEVERQLAEWS